MLRSIRGQDSQPDDRPCSTINMPGLQFGGQRSSHSSSILLLTSRMQPTTTLFALAASVTIVAELVIADPYVY